MNVSSQRSTSERNEKPQVRGGRSLRAEGGGRPNAGDVTPVGSLPGVPGAGRVDVRSRPRRPDGGCARVAGHAAQSARPAPRGHAPRAVRRLVRSLAYGVGSPLHSSLVLGAWLLFGAALAALAALADRRAQPAGAASVSPPAERGGRLYTLHGSVLSLSGAPVARA